MVTADNLIAYYKYDGDATDEIGAFDGTVSGAVSSTAFLGTNSYFFDGSNDIITMGDLGMLAGSTAWSISMWFKFQATISSDEVLFSEGYSVDDKSYCRLMVLGSDILAFQARNNSYSTIFSLTGTSTVTDGSWHHVVATYEAGAQVLYLDGSSQDTDTGTTSNVAIDQSAVGALRRPTNSSYFGGFVDEVGLWSEALTSTAVSELYNSGSGLAYPFTTAVGSVAKINGIEAASIQKINGKQLYEA